MKKFIAMWDSTGLESIVDVTKDFNKANKFEKEKIFNIIKDPDNVPPNEAMSKLGRMIQNMMLRARINSHRNYEIYSVTTNNGITADELTEMFNASPQSTVDLIREKGTEIFSNRKTQLDVIV